MSMLSQVIVFVVCLFIVLSSPVGSIGREECRQRATENMETYVASMTDLLADAKKMSGANKVHNDSACVWCNLVCSEVDNILNVTKVRLDAMKLFSNRTRRIAPIMYEVNEQGYKLLCENDAEMYEALSGLIGDKNFSKSYHACHNFTRYLEDTDPLFYCDPENPSDDPYTTEFLCRNIVDALECLRNNTNLEESRNNGKQFYSNVIERAKSLPLCRMYF